MILKINVKQFVDTTLNHYCARIGIDPHILTISKLDGEVATTFSLEPFGQEWRLEANSLEAAFEGVTLLDCALKGGFARLVSGRHSAKYPLRVLKVDRLSFSEDEAIRVRQLGFNAVISSEWTEERAALFQRYALRIVTGSLEETLSGAVLFHDARSTDEQDALTKAEIYSNQLRVLEDSQKPLIFSLGEEFPGNFAETVISLSQSSAERTAIAFTPGEFDLFSTLENSPYSLARNLLPTLRPGDSPYFEVAEDIWECGELFGVSGGIFEVEALPEPGSIREGVLWSLGHSLYLGYSPSKMYKCWIKSSALC
jgi:hypothetical protein